MSIFDKNKSMKLLIPLLFLTLSAFAQPSKKQNTKYYHTYADIKYAVSSNGGAQIWFDDGYTYLLGRIDWSQSFIDNTLKIPYKHLEKWNVKKGFTEEMNFGTIVVKDYKVLTKPQKF